MLRDRADPDFDWLTLSFPKDLETEFRRDYAQKSVPHVRLGIGVAMALWLLFALLDPVVIPEAKQAAWVIRFAFVVPVLLAIFLFTFSGRFYRYSQPAAAAAFLICSLALTVMVSFWDYTEYSLVPAFTLRSYAEMFEGCYDRLPDLCVTLKTYLSTLKFCLIVWLVTPAAKFSVPLPLV